MRRAGCMRLAAVACWHARRRPRRRPGRLRRPRRRRVLGAVLGGLLGFAASWCCRRAARLAPAALAARLAGRRRRRATPASGARLGYRIERSLRGARARRAEAERTRLTQFLAAMEASPNGVLLLDAQRPDRVVQLARRRSLRPRPAARPAAARHQPGPRAGVRRLPAGRQLRRAGRRSATRARPRARCQVPMRRYGDGAQARALAGHHRARARRGDAARLRRQRLARDPHAADRALGLRRDAAQPAADRGRAASAC